eukprot:m.295694 g.295694  ORF g.295694 m.295694 type:complete len:336 (+) comp20046_c0_seq1:191-1198(+)
MADSLNLVAVLGAVLAIFLLFIVFAEKSGMLESMYPVKKHPSANAFVQLVLAEIILLATVCIGTKYDGKESSCRVMGMLTHFFSLASVAWTCLITGDMYLRSKVVVENPGLPTGLRHSLVAKNAMIVANIAWTIPAVVVLIVGVRTESGCGKINGNEYGGDGFCWIIASKTMVWSYVLLIVLLSIAAIYFAAAWFIMMAAASDNGVISPKLCARIETDLTGCILTFVSGIIAYSGLSLLCISHFECSTTTHTTQVLVRVDIWGVSRWGTQVYGVGIRGCGQPGVYGERPGCVWRWRCDPRRGAGVFLCSAAGYGQGHVERRGIARSVARWLARVD